MESYDIIIVGGGPAGATLARLLAGSFRILLLERRRLDLPFQAGMTGKCCGGLLAPDAQKALAAFDLTLPETVLGGPQIFAVRAFDLDAGIERLYQRFYLNMDREAFDRWSFGLARAAGAECRCGTEFLSCSDGCVRFRSGVGVEESATCRILVAADGAAGAVRRRCGRRPVVAEDLYVALQEELSLVDGARALHQFGAFFAQGESDFYGWCIPKRDTLLFGGAFPRRNAPARFASLKAKLQNRGVDFGSLLRRSGALLIRPRCADDFWYGEGQHLFAVGEAAGFVSPSSAEGFSYAFRSAGILAELLLSDRNVSVAEYARAAAGLRGSLARKNWKSLVMYNPTLRRLVLKSGVGAISASFTGRSNG